jgi:hypothetical protein
MGVYFSHFVPYLYITIPKIENNYFVSVHNGTQEVFKILKLEPIFFAITIGHFIVNAFFSC